MREMKKKKKNLKKRRCQTQVSSKPKRHLRNQNEQEKNSGNKKVPKHVSGSHVKVSILSDENEKTGAKHARM